MPEDPNSLTLALVLTAAGATAAAAVVSGVVELLKQLWSGFGGYARLLAFALSALIVVIAYAAGLQDGTLTLTIPSLFGAFLAFYGIARLSMAVYADVSGEANSLRGPSA
jgi:hypothetical protein